MVNSNPTLSTIAKFHHLNSYLCGEAAEVIKGLAETPENYQVALNLLMDKYKDDKKIERIHQKNLSQLPILRSDLSNLEEFHKEVEINLRSLEALNANVDNSLLLNLLLEKLADPLPARFSKYQRQQGDQQISLAGFRKFLVLTVQDRRLLNLSCSTFGATEVSTKIPTQIFSKISSTKTYCRFFSCRTFTMVKERQERLVWNG